MPMAIKLMHPAAKQLQPELAGGGTSGCGNGGGAPVARIADPGTVGGEIGGDDCCGGGSTAQN